MTVSHSTQQPGFIQGLNGFNVSDDEEIEFTSHPPLLCPHNTPVQDETSSTSSTDPRVDLLNKFLIKSLNHFLINPQDEAIFKKFKEDSVKYLEPCTAILEPTVMLSFFRHLTSQLLLDSHFCDYKFEIPPYHLPTPFALSWIPNHPVRMSIPNPALRTFITQSLDSPYQPHYKTLISHIIKFIMIESPQQLLTTHTIVFRQLHLYYQVELNLKQIILLFLPHIFAEIVEENSNHDFSEIADQAFSTFTFFIFDPRFEKKIQATTTLLESLLLSNALIYIPHKIAHAVAFRDKCMDYLAMLLHYGINETNTIFNSTLVGSLFKMCNHILSPIPEHHHETLMHYTNRAFAIILTRYPDLAKELATLAIFKTTSSHEDYFPSLHRFESTLEHSFILADLYKLSKFKALVLKKKELDSITPCTPKRVPASNHSMQEPFAKKIKSTEVQAPPLTPPPPPSPLNGLIPHAVLPTPALKPIQGFPNPGNICFISSALQSLFCMPMFVEMLHRPLEKKTLSNQIFEFRSRLQISLIQLEALRKTNEDLKGPLNDVVKLLFELVPDIKDKPGAFHDVANVIETLLEIFDYSLNYKQTYQGTGIHKELNNSKQDKWFVFPITMKPRKSLQKLVELTLSENLVNDKNNPWTATDKSGTEIKLKKYHSKQTLLDPLPNMIVLQIKRMEYDPTTKQTVQIEGNITYSDPIKINSTFYRLKACIHQVSELFHYHSDVLINDSFYRCDDTSIEKIEKPEAENAYIYFLEKI